MDIDIKDSITLSDGNCYTVVSKTRYEDNMYYYLIDCDNIENIIFCVENTKKSSLIVVEDKHLVRQLLPFFAEAASKAITKEDIELMQQEVNE